VPDVTVAAIVSSIKWNSTRGIDIRQHTDAELVEASLRGSHQAFGELVRRYQDVLYRHAERMTGRVDDAEDVVQATFIKAHQNLRSCRDPDRVGAWLFRIGANACKDFLKARRRSSVPLDEVPGLPARGGNPEEDVEVGRVRSQIERALRLLPADQREAFLMKHVEGWSYAEMAERLGASVSALKMRVHRARDELQVLLESYRR
jgi:RNA polymerase sigma-70 factor (ECF subfamily)